MQQPPPLHTSERDTVLVLGGPSVGKTVWVARLVEALRQPAEVVGGRVVDAAVARGTGEFGSHGTVGIRLSGTTLSCEPADAETEAHIRGVLESLARKEWPLPTAETREHVLDFSIQTTGAQSHRRLRFVELSGSALLSAFSPSNPSTLTISWTAANQLERTCAVIALVDPAEVIESTRESTDALNALIAMLRLLRSSSGGMSVPVAIVLSKCDRGYKALLRAGGVRRFIGGHLNALVSAAGAGRVYVSSATRSRLVAPRLREPSTRRPVENLIEPMAYLLEVSAQVDAMRASIAREGAFAAPVPADADPANAATRDDDESSDRGISSWIWVVFAVGMLAAAFAAVDAALSWNRPQQPAPASAGATDAENRKPDAPAAPSQSSAGAETATPAVPGASKETEPKP